MAAVRVPFTTKTDPAEISKITKAADDVWDEAYKYYSDKSDWKVSKNGPDGAVVYMKKVKGKSVFKLEGICDLDPETFYKKFFGMEEAEAIPEWNPNIQLVQILQEVAEGTHLVYQALASIGPGGLVAGRDMIIVRKMQAEGGKFIVTYASYNLPEIKATKGIVRAEVHPSIAVVEAGPNGKTMFTWVIDMDLKLSLIPTSIFNQVFQYLLLDNMKSIRERCVTLSSSGK